MPKHFARLDFAPGWQTTNANLGELVDLFGGERLLWMPRDGEWPAWVVYAHLIGARYHGPIATAPEMDHLEAILQNCRTAEGIKHELEVSWDMLARFLCDVEKLDATYAPGSPVPASQPPAPPLLGSVERALRGLDLGYVDRPEQYSGHYIAYHRFAHDLHHRATLIDYLSQLHVSLDGHRIRPL